MAEEVAQAPDHTLAVGTSSEQRDAFVARPGDDLGRRLLIVGDDDPEEIGAQEPQ